MCKKTYNESSEFCFEDFKNQDGITFWWASELMLMLGYDDIISFRKIIDKCTKTFISLGIDHYENIVYVEREVNGSIIPDFKLTRFACFLIVLSANPQKTEVINMQSYFLFQARKFELYFVNKYTSDKHNIHDEIKKGTKRLVSIAEKQIIEDFAALCDESYLARYNTMNWQLIKHRKSDTQKILETSKRAELAANLFKHII